MHKSWGGAGGWAVFFGRTDISKHESFLHPFLLFHPSVLEPYFYLGFVQLQSCCDFYSSGSGQVLVVVKLLFKLGELFGGEIRSPGTICPSVRCICSRCS